MKNKEIYPQILDYEQVLEKLDKIQSNKIKVEKPIGYTTYGLPLLHYTVGNGANHIVISGATHGCEIITTDFIVRTMEEIANENQKFDFLKNNQHTIHFIPMINPEGYLISTSAIRTKIPRDMPLEQAQEIYKKYLAAYNEDDKMCHLRLDTKEKQHQKFFKDIDYTCIPEKYVEIREKIKKLYETYNIPKGTLPTWSSNANGVDINQNTPYNYKIQCIKDNVEIFSILRYNNISTTIPGPIGCPMAEKEFAYEPETRAIQEFLFALKNDKNINLCAYLNYHSTGGEIYQKPYQKAQEINDKELMPHIDIEEIYNKQIAKIYAEMADYKVIDNIPKLTCFNDLLRLQVPGDLLIELSKTSGNPIATYIKDFYIETMTKNSEALALTMEKLPEMNKIKQKYINKRETKEELQKILNKTKEEDKEI